MSFISYAQNFEDVMLWRALQHVEKGFYIDIGANDPSVDSVTRAFYDRGWRGINVEPMRQYYEQLRIHRPADVNLPIAVGDRPGTITFFDIPDTGLSTTDAAIAEPHIAAGRPVTRQSVEMTTLADICRTHAQGPIHFLKIDVEGFESAVLRGMDFRQWRPWILVIEATKPQTQITNHQEWEHLVLDAAYRFAYFDGLNHYYVADEHAELLQALKTPPNFFDRFHLRYGHYFSYPVAELEERLRQAEERVRDVETKSREALELIRQAEEKAKASEARAYQELDQRLQAEANVQRLEHELNGAQVHVEQTIEQKRLVEAQLQGIYTSLSWRVTYPLRAIKRVIAGSSKR